MTGVRSYVQELINHAIVSEVEFPISWKVFQLQFPILEEKYLANAKLLQEVLDWKTEIDGNRIIWLLTQKETTLIANAIARINTYFLKILGGDPVTMDELGKDEALLKAGIALEKSYGKGAGTGNNEIGKWTPVDLNFYMDILLGTKQQLVFELSGPGHNTKTVDVFTHGDFYRFGGIIMVKTSDRVFKTDNYYYKKQDDEYVLLVAGHDYQIGDSISEFGSTIYEESVLQALLNNGYIDFMVDEPYQPVADESNVPVKFGIDLTTNNQEPTILQLQYSGEPVPVPYPVSGETIPNAYYTFKHASVKNIADLNSKGIALFHYDRHYDWEKDLANKSITSNLHIRKLIKGWFGHGKTGWSKDINSIPYIQTLDEHQWANVYKKHVQRYINLVNAIKVDDLLALVAGDPEEFYLLFKIANLYAVRHELLSIYFRALNEIRKKGLYRI